MRCMNEFPISFLAKNPKSSIHYFYSAKYGGHFSTHCIWSLVNGDDHAHGQPPLPPPHGPAPHHHKNLIYSYFSAPFFVPLSHVCCTSPTHICSSYPCLEIHLFSFGLLVLLWVHVLVKTHIPTAAHVLLLSQGVSKHDWRTLSGSSEVFSLNVSPTRPATHSSAAPPMLTKFSEFEKLYFNRWVSTSTLMCWQSVLLSQKYILLRMRDSPYMRHLRVGDIHCYKSNSRSSCSSHSSAV